MEELKRLNPSISHITYTVNDIFNYIDSMTECNLLVYTLDTDFQSLGLSRRLVDIMLLESLELKENCLNISTV